jgi:predicted HTH transcriptional regulator
VILLYRKHRAAPPTFAERQSFLVVTFKIRLVAEDVEETPATQSATQSSDPVERLLTCLVRREMSAEELRSALRIKHRP